MSSNSKPVIPADYGRDRLPYPYSYVPNPVTDVNIDVDYTNPSNRSQIVTDCNLLIGAMTPQQMLETTSALLMGAALIYPERWQQVIQPYLQISELVNTLTWRDCDVPYDLITICDIVRDCLGVGPEDEDGPVDEPGESGPGRGDYEGNERKTATNSLDCVWGATGKVHDIVLDYARLVGERVNAALDGIDEYEDSVVGFLVYFPGITTRLASAAVDIFQGVTAAINNDYQATIELQAVEDDLRCAVFCAIKNNNTPYTLTRGIIRDALSDWQTALADNSAAITPPIAQFYKWLLSNTINYDVALRQWRVAADDENICNNNWQQLCSCPSPPQTFTVTFDASGYQNYVNKNATSQTFGNPAPSLKAGVTMGSGNTNGQAIVTLDSTRQIDNIAMDCHYVTDNGTLFARVRLLDDQENILGEETIDQTGSGWRTVQFSLTGTAKKLQYVVGRASGFDPDEVYADNLTWRQQ